MATIMVDTLNDVVNAGDGVTSLREAIAIANFNDTIVFDPSLAGGTVRLTQGELVLTQSISIDGDTDGDNRADITISGDADNSGTATSGDSRIFNIETSTEQTGLLTSVSLSSLVLENGFAENGKGGAIRFDGHGVLNVEDTYIHHNTAGLSGGGIYGSYLSTINLLRSTLAYNEAGNSGGGAEFLSTANITQSTIGYNTATYVGGGISAAFQYEHITLTNSTVSQNYAGASGGGLYSLNAPLTFYNTVVADNASGFGSYDDVDTLFVDVTAQHSVFGTIASITNDYGYNLTGVGSVSLGPLMQAGAAPVPTFSNSSSLFLIDGGAWSLLPEPQGLSANGGAGVAGIAIDVGAHEAQLVVTTLSDEADNGGGLAAEAADGNGLSLREALGAANAGLLNVPITFDPSLAGGVMLLANGQMNITNNVWIDGDIDNDGRFDISINAQSLSRIFDITDGAIATIDGLFLFNGFVDSDDTAGGGAIRVDGAELVLFRSTLAMNKSEVSGGAIEIVNSINNPGNLLPSGSVLDSVTIFGNQSEISGAGVHIYNSDVSVINSTLHDNYSYQTGGGLGIVNGPDTGTLFVHNSTITNNLAAFGGGGIRATNASIALYNTVMAQNAHTIPGYLVANDLTQSGSYVTAGGSFFSTNVTINNDLGYNQTNAGTPLLASLLDNGGGVATRTPENRGPGFVSPLIDTGEVFGSVNDFIDANGNYNIFEFLPFDGRLGDRILGADIDIGAVEYSDNDVVRGLDVIYSRIGPIADTITTGIGDDILEGGAGGDILNGGDGSDTASYESSNAGVTVTIGGSISGGHATGDTFISIENLIGSAHVDLLTGDGNDNTLEGGAGGDTLNGGAGSDTASYAHAGRGVVVSLADTAVNTGDAFGDVFISIENLQGSIFDDFLSGDSNNNVIDGGGGRDTIDFSDVIGGVEVRLNTGTATGAGIGSDTLISIENVVGSQGNDLIFGNDEANLIHGQGGDDVIFALGDNDFVYGGDGNDTLNGNLSDDNLYGGAGDDVLLGAQGEDWLEGNDGNDVLSGGAGDDNLYGGAGDDQVLGGADNDYMQGNDGNDTLSGGSGNDTLIGGNDDDLVLGAGGDDFLYGDDGADTVSGGTGNDFVFGNHGDDSVIGADGDDFEVNGGGGNDVVSGGNGNDNVLGGSGDDNVLGAAGNDRVDGGTGTDTITGGDGADTLVFHLGYGNDTAPGFENDLDTLELDDALWGGGLTAQQVVDTFATQTSPGIVDFDFGGGDTLRVVNGGGIAKNDLVDDILIV